MNKTKIIAEIGINHNGSLETALELCSMAKECGVDYVKFQKRTPELCVPRNQWGKPKYTPWGETIPYIEYREKMEFGLTEFLAIDEHCRSIGIQWGCSVWDDQSLEFLLDYFPKIPFIKIPSALMENRKLQEKVFIFSKTFNIELIVSTGMHNSDEVYDHCDWLEDMVYHYNSSDITIMSCHSAYPTPEKETNLEAIKTLAYAFSLLDVGFSSHSQSPFVPIHAISYAQPKYVEVHITLDRSMTGTDHAASLEKNGLRLLVREKERFFNILGDGEIHLWDSELPAREKMKV